ncbi:alpha/beta hydrolase fold domain-containing protein [Demequina sp.]|uniref:alpha/beta hydrolase fold domain-containing protein n=1 Tax=Demequina sp. TaxID=2050685 RepID=UPI003A88E8DB
MISVESLTLPSSFLPWETTATRHDVPARLYRPSTADAPAGSGVIVNPRGIVWAHGGGFVHGDLDMPEGDHVARTLAEAGHTVLSVDYRLVEFGGDWSTAPTFEAARRFPAAHDDLGTAFAWLHTQAETLGVDPATLVIGGASAGACLAASAALHLCRDAASASALPSPTPRPAGLMLAYPTVHAALPEHDATVASAVADLPDDRRFFPHAVAGMNLHYVGDPALLDDPYALPGGHDLAAMPPTVIVNSERDDLRTSGEHLARELEAAGVAVECSYELGATHGHLNQPHEPFAARTLTTYLTWLAATARA